MVKDLLGSGFAIRRAAVAVTMTAALATSLSGCLFAYDAATPEITFVNDYPEPVVFAFEGRDPEFAAHVAAGSSISRGLYSCDGSGIRVETESGDLLAQMDEEVCPDGLLTINADGSLTYEDLTP